MTPPESFVAIYITTRNLPYQCVDEHSSGLSMTGGVLGKGTPVWTEPLLLIKSHSVAAWVEDIGVVAVDARCLTAWTKPAPQRMTQLPLRRPFMSAS